MPHWRVSPMSESTARDELVTLLGEHVHFRGIGQCRCGSPIPFADCGPDVHWDAHLADVLLAAGWTKGDA